MRVGVAERAARAAEDGADTQAERASARRRRPDPPIRGNRADGRDQRRVHLERPLDDCAGRSDEASASASAFTPLSPRSSSAMSMGARSRLAQASSAPSANPSHAAR